jgi:tetratricopeptide (TPR) repeat protein
MKHLAHSLLAAALLLGAPAFAQPADPAAAAVSEALRLGGEGDIAGAIARLEAVPRTTAPRPLLSLLGALYLDAGRTTDAMNVLAPLAADPAADPAVLFNAFRAAAAAGEKERARQWLERSAAQAPASPAARQLGMILASEGKVVEAYAKLRPWVLAEPSDGDARVAAAGLAVQLERPAEALQLLDGLDTAAPALRLLRGRALVQAGKPADAVALLRPLLANHPEGMEAEVRRSLAEAYLGAGQAGEAVTVLSGHTAHPATVVLLARAERLSKRTAKARELLTPLVSQLPADRTKVGDPRPPARAAAEYAYALLDEGKAGEAVPWLEKSVALFEADAEAWTALSRAYAAAGRAADADKARERLAGVQRASQRAAVELPRLGGARAGMPTTGGPLAGAAPPPGTAPVPMPEGMEEAVRIMGERPADALALTRKAKLAAPTDLRPRMLEVRLLLALRRNEEALDAAEAALSMGPDRPELLYQRGAVLLALRRLDEGERDLRRALELAPSYTPAMNDLGVLLASKGRPDEAIPLFERVLQINPGDPMAKASLERARNAPQPQPPKLPARPPSGG